MKRTRSRGQGLVEFAMVIPLIILLVFAIIDLGRGIFVYNTLAQAARQAARTAIVNQNVDEVRAAAYSSAPSLGLGAGNVSVCFKESGSGQVDCSSSTGDCSAADRSIGCLAIVEAELNYMPMTPVIGSIIGTVALSSTSVQPIEYVCPYTGHTTCP
jgi:Flp pilus assembly protein TadG